MYRYAIEFRVVADPDPHHFGKPDPVRIVLGSWIQIRIIIWEAGYGSPHCEKPIRIRSRIRIKVKSRIRIPICFKVKFRSCGLITEQWRAVERSQNGGF
jgi:hypothetical protein